MRHIYFNIEGHSTSGVATFCNRVAEGANDSFIVSLNCTSEKPRFSNELLIEPSLSHNPKAIVKSLLEYLRQNGGVAGDWVLFPNVGDDCYASSLLLKQNLLRGEVSSVAIVGICHSDDENQYKVMQHYSEYLDSVLAVSSCIQKKLYSLLGVAFAERIFRLSYPVPHLELSSKPQSSTASPTLIYLGRLVREQKRIERLPVLVEELLRRKFDFRLLVVGDGKEREFVKSEFKRLTENWGWEDFQLLGFLNQTGVYDALAKSDISLLFSEYEGTPISVLEAISVGVHPVVMNMDCLCDGLAKESSEIVTQGDLIGMAQAIIDLWKDREKFQLSRLKGRERVLKEHSTANCILHLKTASLAALAHSREKVVSIPSRLGYFDGKIERLLSDIGLVGDSIVVFGAGMFGRKVVDRLVSMGRVPVAILDSDSLKWNTEYRGIEILEPKSLLDKPVKTLVVASDSFVEEILASLKEHYSVAELELPKLLFLPPDSE
ncbi:glycosyltransferase family 4 protein [Puniceicoccaceae bacterium K14]|nr:glycosyltransferase family 4 protein [Puniceicoccaceae bacterium K14]